MTKAQCFAERNEPGLKGAVAVQFRGRKFRFPLETVDLGTCDYYRLSGAAPTDCPYGYSPGQGYDQTAYSSGESVADKVGGGWNMYCKLNYPLPPSASPSPPPSASPPPPTPPVLPPNAPSTSG